MLKISPINNVVNFKNNKIIKNKSNPIKDDYPIQNDILGVPASYISFKGKVEDDFKLTENAKALVNRAKNIAIENGNEEITPFHIIEAAIQEHNFALENVPQELVDSGAIESLSTLNKLANTAANLNLLQSDNLFEYLSDTIEGLKVVNEEYLKTLPVKEELKGKMRDVDFSEDLKNQLNGYKNDVTTFDAYMILGAAFNANTKQNIFYTSEFLQSMKSLNFYKKSDEINANYMKYYDAKAVDAWNKLALGSNMFITYNDAKEGNRLCASLINTINAPKHGNFGSKTTMPYFMSDFIKPSDLVSEVSMIQEAEPDKQKLFIINLDNLLANSINPEDEKLQFPMEIFSMVNGAPENVKFIFLQDSDVHYQLLKDSALKKAFSGFVSYSIPPMHAYEAQGVIKSDKKLLKDVKTPFSKEAREKAIQYADKIEGIYPDKAVDLMKKIASYYGDDKKRISAKDVDEFAAIANELFNKDEGNTNVIYDTGKTLASLYGKSTTKKDLEAIVRQIKSGSIGTRGYIMYSDDEEAGSGRRFSAQAIAGEAKVPYMEIASSDFAVSVEDANGIKNSPANVMSKIFSEIKKAAQQNENKTAILFVNNFEEFAFSGPYLAGYRQAMTQMEKEMTRAEMEGLNIIVIGSTDADYASAIPSVVKGFNQTITIDSPAFNKQARREILENRIKEVKVPLAGRTKQDKEHVLDKLVKLTEYMSFVEIKTMVEKTKQIMAERNKKKATMGDFIEAYLQLTTGRTSRPEMPDYNKRNITSHECGHAVNLEIMDNILQEKGKPWHQSRKVNFITLDPRGDFLGAVFEGNSDNHTYSFEAMFTGLVCAYGGNSAEKMFFDLMGSAGISQDLAQAAASAKRGVEYFGFGHNTGRISNAANLKSGEYSENVYKDVNVILNNAQIASDLIMDTYKGFNKWFTDKYSKLIGTDDCMIDGDDFRKILAQWKKVQPKDVQESFEILGDMVMDIIKASKNGVIYGKIKAIK